MGRMLHGTAPSRAGRSKLAHALFLLGMFGLLKNARLRTEMQCRRQLDATPAKSGSLCFKCDLGRFRSPYPCGFPYYDLSQPAWILGSLTPFNCRFFLNFRISLAGLPVRFVAKPATSTNLYIWRGLRFRRVLVSYLQGNGQIACNWGVGQDFGAKTVLLTATFGIFPVTWGDVAGFDTNVTHAPGTDMLGFDGTTSAH